MRLADYEKWIKRFKDDGIVTLKDPNKFLFNYYECPDFLNYIIFCLNQKIFKPEDGKPVNVNILVDSVRYCIVENDFLLHINMIQNGFRKEYIVKVTINGDKSGLSISITPASRIELAYFENANILKKIWNDY